MIRSNFTVQVCMQTYNKDNKKPIHINPPCRNIVGFPWVRKEGGMKEDTVYYLSKWYVHCSVLTDCLPSLVHVTLWPFGVSVSQSLLLGLFLPDPPGLLSLGGLQQRHCVLWLVVVLSLGTRLPFTLLIHLSVCSLTPTASSSTSLPWHRNTDIQSSPPKVLLCYRLKVPCLFPLARIFTHTLPCFYATPPPPPPSKILLSHRLCALINYSSVPSRLGSASTTETSDGQLSLGRYIQTGTKKRQTVTCLAASVVILSWFLHVTVQKSAAATMFLLFVKNPL